MYILIGRLVSLYLVKRRLVIQQYAKSIEDNSVPHQVMPASKVNKKYSDLLQLPEDYLCLTEEDGGILRASKAVATLQVS